MNPRFKALNSHRNWSTGMAFNGEKVFAKQCISGRLNIDCHLSFNRNVKDISGPTTLVEMREWKAMRLKQKQAMKPSRIPVSVKSLSLTLSFLIVFSGSL
jgi:hypothetical protein